MISTISTYILFLPIATVSAIVFDPMPSWKVPQRGVKVPEVRMKVPEVDQRCLECICQASSHCDESMRCHHAGGGYFCGPFVISWAYWYDSGRPGNRGETHDFEECLTNRKCAEESVRGYMRRYGRDCDNSGHVDCHDFARIHKLGFGHCSRNDIQYSEYWRQFQMCYRQNTQSADRDNRIDYYYYDY